MLLDRLNADMKEAMKARETLRVSVLRMTLAEAKNARIEKGADLTDDEVVKVLRSALKKREEAVEQYRQGNRPELADKEAQEAVILQDYLPQTLKGAELQAAVEAAIRESEAKSIKDLGKVMKALLASHGSQVEAKVAQVLVRERLENV